MNIPKFAKRFAAARKLRLTFTGLSRFPMPSVMTFGFRKISIHAPPEPGLAIDFVELILDDDYGLLEFEVPPKTIVDIGGNIGLFSLWAGLIFPDSRIHCYEPNPRLHEYLAKNLRGRAILHGEGVGSKEGRASMLDNEESRLGQVVTGAGDASLSITAIHTVLERTGGHADLLKMDCEGSEWDILEDTASIGKFREIRMEYHEIGGHTLADLDGILSGAGFVRTYLKPNNGFGIAYYKNLSRDSRGVGR